MKNNSIYIIIFIQLILFISAIIFNRNEAQKSNVAIINLSHELEDASFQMFKSFELSNSKIELEGLLDRQYFCLYISDVSCQSCRDSLTSEFYEFSKKIGIENIVVFANYSKEIDLIRYIRVHRLQGGKIIKVTSETSHIFSSNQSLLFVFNGHTKESSHVFIPQLNQTVTQKYFNIINAKFKIDKMNNSKL